MTNKKNIPKAPLVSICIPTYNGEKYLEEALISALNQTYQNIEIVISDDNSSDSTLEVANKIKNKTKIPFFIFHHQPNGIGANWNNCVRKANSNYIKFLFQDDILKPICIEKMMQIALMGKNIGLVFSKRDIIYSDRNKFFDDWMEHYEHLHTYWENLKTINSGVKLLKKCNCLLESPENKVGEPVAVLLRKEVFKKAGVFDETLVQALDFEFWYRVFKYYKIGFIDEALVSFRLHQGQATVKNNNIGNEDYVKYEKSVYKNLFFQVAPNIQKRLFKKYNKCYNLLRKLRSAI